MADKDQAHELIVATPERVAFDLMMKIDETDLSATTRNRQYWLTLYRQCYKATTGHPLERILEEK